ncbi:hypothetical protein M404DRAFT_166340 [Pisolithus tinctorius Marx 270]|uniref:Uncharacterized protein n=1 Tax=Pisolithus tinctorius Marx 270 TaxID=870435 RepID=A0A0C3NII7_PISTI|nr:hypothetical protein M404DRAFT_166340 [Pisolithus tinctorius Marx 270]
MSSPSPIHSSERPHAFAVVLAVYSTIKKKGNGRGFPPKEGKSVKMKEILIVVNDGNYIKFPKSILEKHGYDNYRVSEKKCYLFKFVPPQTKSQGASNAMDIDNEVDYQEMVKKPHLSCFLSYTETNLSVLNTSMYEKDLELQGIGPDILADIDDKTHTLISFSTRDIIHLKKGSLVWWNGPEAKLKQRNAAVLSQSIEQTSDSG